MASWWQKPRELYYWPDDIDYMMFVDENNHPNLLKKAIKCVKNNQQMEDNERFFTVTGCVVSKESLVQIIREVTTIKNTYWDNGMHYHAGEYKRICFHSADIRRAREPFDFDTAKYRAFANDLGRMIANADFKVFSATLDLYAHAWWYAYPAHPYELCINFIFERFAKWFLGAQNKKGVVMIERRGEKEDKQLHKYIIELLNNGTRYVSSRQFSRIKAVYFNPKRTHDGLKTYVGLELADLISYPIFKYCKTGTQDKAYQLIERKFYRYPSHKGAGLKLFPNSWL